MPPADARTVSRTKVFTEPDRHRLIVNRCFQYMELCKPVVLILINVPTAILKSSILWAAKQFSNFQMLIHLYS